METELQKETDLSQVKQLTFTGWSTLSDGSFISQDTDTQVECILIPKKGKWEANLMYQGQKLATLKEKVLDESKVFEVTATIKGVNSVRTVHAVERARAQDKLGIHMDGYTYRYTANGNLYRLFTGTTERGMTLLPKLQYFTIYARLNKTPSASMVVNLELKTSPNQDKDYVVQEHMSMDDIDKYLAANPHLVGE